jgi:hypothetical protein
VRHIARQAALATGRGRPQQVLAPSKQRVAGSSPAGGNHRKTCKARLPPNSRRTGALCCGLIVAQRHRKLVAHPVGRTPRPGLEGGERVRGEPSSAGRTYAPTPSIAWVAWGPGAAGRPRPHSHHAHPPPIFALVLHVVRPRQTRPPTAIPGPGGCAPHARRDERAPAEASALFPINPAPRPGAGWARRPGAAFIGNAPGSSRFGS